MADIRTTERLLEFIEQRTDDERASAAIEELCRRGDTLVRRDDLRSIAVLAEWATEDDSFDEVYHPGIRDALARVNAALGEPENPSRG